MNIKGTTLAIVPLSRANIDEAIELVHSVFPREAKQGIPEVPYWDSLNHTGLALESNRLEYYVAFENRQIIGVTGVFDEKDDTEAAWLGWFCVHPAFRGKGYGRQILEWTLALARSYGYKRFVVYTSRDPAESTAQLLYEKLGLVISSEEIHPGEPYDIIYREKTIA
ncbi:MAG TPA: GNAT family N-acetyltransferase [Candidatus Paceibacterota bacterium]|nr:GNAT family N-acetyltransferase [Candidatus Paceibacterota bacterium]